MANQEHLNILSQGIDAWNQWRKENPTIIPDLSFVDLSKSDLRRIDFHKVNLSDADLEDTELNFANLNRANLSSSDLSFADLSNVNLDFADMSNSKLRGANLNGANLASTDLTFADLRDTKLTRCNMANTKMSRAMCGNTLFADVDLSIVDDLEGIWHQGPSTIGLDTLLNFGKLPIHFLIGCGVPKTTVENLPYILDVPAIELYSCFISYSTADTEFAELLHNRLQEAGVNCWFAPEQILPGQRIDDEIEYGIRHWDKVLFVCSESSLTEKWWVDFEKDKALKKERDLQRQRGQKVGVLIPLNIDGYLFSDKFDTDAHRSLFEMRLAGDFVGWKNDMDKFNREVEKVIRALRTDGGRTRPPKSKL